MTRDHAWPAAVGALAVPRRRRCSGPQRTAAAICPATDAFPLTTGQNDAGNAGDVKVCNDADKLFVTYEATYPFCLLETHLHVAPIGPDDDKDVNIPQNPRGHPTPGKFAYGDMYPLECEGEDTFEIPLAAIGEEEEGVSFGDTVVVAAFAILEDEDEKEEEAWGGTELFVERGRPRATYFTYEVEDPACGGDGSCTMFITDNQFTGDLGGLDGADDKCQGEADGADDLAGTYRAWLSDFTGSPSTRFETQAAFPYVDVLAAC